MTETDAIHFCLPKTGTNECLPGYRSPERGVTNFTRHQSMSAKERNGGKKTRNKSSVHITEFSARRVQNVPHSDIFPQTHSRDHRIQVEERRSSGGIRRRQGSIHLSTNTASRERNLVARIPLLPIVPNLVNPRMVKEEQRIIWGPPRTIVAPGRSQSKRTHPRHVSSNNEVWSRMRPGETLSILLEFDIIPRPRIHGIIHNRFRERRVHHRQWVFR